LSFSIRSLVLYFRVEITAVLAFAELKFVVLLYSWNFVLGCCVYGWQRLNFPTQIGKLFQESEKGSVWKGKNPDHFSCIGDSRIAQKVYNRRHFSCIGDSRIAHKVHNRRPFSCIGDTRKP